MMAWLSTIERRFDLRPMAVCLALLMGGLTPPPLVAAESEVLWRALQSPGHVALLRHAIAPGTGDPEDFEIGDCATQRNLSDEGREQAASIGARLKENGVESARVFSSQWCRCLETASLLGLGPVEELPALNSFFGRPERRDVQTEELKAWFAEQELDQPTVLVTHQVNISALTGVYPSSGELVIVRVGEGGDLSALGSVETE
jgi:phosphohistidine phosphatase SixA